jgi:hypothetical protein
MQCLETLLRFVVGSVVVLLQGLVWSKLMPTRLNLKKETREESFLTIDSFKSLSSLITSHFSLSLSHEQTLTWGRFTKAFLPDFTQYSERNAGTISYKSLTPCHAPQTTCKVRGNFVFYFVKWAPVPASVG